MSRKVKDIVAKVGEYTDRNGQTKARWQNVGALMEDKDGQPFIMLARWFNPAGVPSDRESILLSCFAPKEQGAAPAPDRGAPAGDMGGDMDDEVPFSAEWR